MIATYLGNATELESGEWKEAQAPRHHSSFVPSESATFWDKNKGTEALDQNNDNSIKNEELGLNGHFPTHFLSWFLTKNFLKSHTFHDSPTHLNRLFFKLLCCTLICITSGMHNFPRNYIPKFTTSLLSSIFHNW